MDILKTSGKLSILDLFVWDAASDEKVPVIIIAATEQNLVATEVFILVCGGGLFFVSVAQILRGACLYFLARYGKLSVKEGVADVCNKQRRIIAGRGYW